MTEKDKHIQEQDLIIEALNKEVKKLERNLKRAKSEANKFKTAYDAIRRFVPYDVLMIFEKERGLYGEKNRR